MKISTSFIILLLVITCSYFLLSVYFQNISLINSTIFTPADLGYKITLLTALILGFSSTMNALQFTLFVITGVFIGINLTLILQRVISVKKTSKGYFIAGSSSLVGIFSGGCASCGLPLLSLLGLSGAVLYLPFKGAELPYISIILLFVSCFFLIKSTDKNAQMCKIEKRNHRK